MPSLTRIRREIVEIGRRLYNRGMLAGGDGNISALIDNDRLVITPSGRPKGRLSPDELVIVDTEGNLVEGPGRASSEIAMHLFVYRRRPEIRACIHSHAPYVTSFALAGEQLPENLLPEVVVFVGAIPLTEYAPPGTDAVPRSLEPYVGNSSAFCLRNHGLLTIGRTLEEAYNRHETVEHFARVVHLARQLGTPHPIPKDDFRRLKQLRESLNATPSEQGDS